MKELNRDKEENQINISGKQQLLLSIWLIAAVLEGLLAFLLFLRIPGVSEVAWIGDFSKTRFTLFVCLLGGLIFLMYLTYRTWRFPSWANMIIDRIQILLQSGSLYWISVGLMLFGVVITGQLISFSFEVSDPFIEGYLLRIRPLFIWSFGLFGQTLLMLPTFRYGFRERVKIFQNKSIIWSGIIFLVFITIGILIVISKIGIEPDIVGWDGPGTPIQFAQVVIICMAGVVFLLSGGKTRKWGERKKLLRYLFISLILWGVAFVLWSLEPLTPDYFAPVPRAPNYEVYPYSDAALHDSNAHELLIGEGFPGISRKPLYVLFLAFLHAIRGQSYNEIIQWQVGILALLPVLIFFLSERLHSSTAGFIASCLVILRERNAISLSGEIRVSHSKLLMSDMPAVLAVVLLTLLLVVWLRKPEKRSVFPIWIGGVSGLLLLLRPQFSLIIPIVFLIILVQHIRRPKFCISSLSKIILGMFLTLSPWLWRSFIQTGTVTLNDPKQMAFLTEQYHLIPQTESLDMLPSETVSEFSSRINRYLRDFVLKNPRYVAGFISSHFVHNEIEMIQALPMSFWLVNNPDSDLFPHWRKNFNKLWNDCCSLDAYVKANQFWDPWLEKIQRVHLLPIGLNLAILSIGISSTWFHSRVLGLLPLGISLAYSISTAVGRYSGWRLILPADWVVLVYYAAGITQGIFWMRRFFQNIPQQSDEDRWESISYHGLGVGNSRGKTSVLKFLVTGLILLVIGAIPLIVEDTVPPRYRSRVSMKDLIKEFPQFGEDELQRFVDEEGGKVVLGRALYPRYYRSGEGEPGESWTAFLVRDFPRLGFYVIGPEKVNVILPMEFAPEWFPHASDVIILGCNKDTYLDAAVVKIEHADYDEGQVILREPMANLTCPLISP